MTEDNEEKKRTCPPKNSHLRIFSQAAVFLGLRSCAFGGYGSDLTSALAAACALASSKLVGTPSG